MKTNTQQTATLLASLLLAITLINCEATGNNFTDPSDGKKYKTVKMPDGKVWMAENLNHRVEGSKCYDANEENCKKYGRLYTWEQAMKACPKGWYLPGEEELNTLIKAVGDSSTAGTKLKAKSGWNEIEGKSGNGSDVFGFSALPGGFGTGARFLGAGIGGTWWGATEKSAEKRNFIPSRGWVHSIIVNAYILTMAARHEDLFIKDDGDKTGYFSVRCVKD